MLQTGQVSSRIGQARVLVPLHSHREALLIVNLRGRATIGTSSEEYALPPRSLLWLAGHTAHRVHTSADHHSLILSFPPELVLRNTGLIEASGFVHDLVARVSQTPDPARRERLTAVLVDELAAPVPESTRLRRVTELVVQQPSLAASALARELGMSERNFRRWFRAESGKSFARWQQEHAVACAIEQLERGESVKSVAIDLGYTSPSAFSAMFKRITNVPPQRYLRSR